MKVKSIVDAKDGEDFVVVENDGTMVNGVIITLCGGGSVDKAIHVDGNELIRAITNAMNC